MNGLMVLLVGMSAFHYQHPTQDYHSQMVVGPQSGGTVSSRIIKRNHQPAPQRPRAASPSRSNGISAKAQTPMNRHAAVERLAATAKARYRQAIDRARRQRNIQLTTHSDTPRQLHQQAQQYQRQTQQYQQRSQPSQQRYAQPVSKSSTTANTTATLPIRDNANASGHSGVPVQTVSEFSHSSYAGHGHHGHYHGGHGGSCATCSKHGSAGFVPVSHGSDWIGGGCRSCKSCGGCKSCGHCSCGYNPWDFHGYPEGCCNPPLCGDECDDDDDDGCCGGKYKCRSTCNMFPHYPYYPCNHGYYYFRPYNYTHIEQHKATAARLGIDPMEPYSTEIFDTIYAEMMLDEYEGMPLGNGLGTPAAAVGEGLPDLQEMLAGN